MLSNLKHRTARAAQGAMLLLASLGLGAAYTGGALTASSAMLMAPQQVVADDTERKNDVVIFRSGQQVQGEILEETPTTVRMRVVVAGMAAETTYNKSDILSIMRGEGDAIEPKKESESTAARPSARPGAVAAATPGDTNRKRVYVMELTGVFGQDISQTPIRQAVRDAQRHNTDYLIVKVNNDFSFNQGTELAEEMPEDVIGAFDLLFRALDIEPIFSQEIPREWDNPPKVVFWIRNAMGGAAFLPLSCRDIYFHSEGKMGGVGYMDTLFDGVGDEVVRQKQYSLRVTRAEGLAIAGGYDPRIVKAMAEVEYVLSVRFEGGKPVFIVGEPERDGDIQLTNNGRIREQRDTIQMLARGEGKNILTLKPDIALKLGVSKGNADTVEDLMFHLGIARNYQLVNGQSDRIMKTWRDSVQQAQRNLRRMWEREFPEIQVQGDYRERTAARGRQIRLIEEMQAIIKRYEEAFDPRWFGVPDYDTLNLLKEQIKLQQLGDRR